MLRGLERNIRTCMRLKEAKLIGVVLNRVLGFFLGRFNTFAGVVFARFNAPIFEHKKRLSSVHFSFCAFHPFGRALLPGRQVFSSVDQHSQKRAAGSNRFTIRISCIGGFLPWVLSPHDTAHRCGSCRAGPHRQSSLLEDFSDLSWPSGKLHTPAARGLG